MDKSERDQWLQGFVADLSIDGERVPLERIVETRLDGFTTLRDQGLTWRAIAALIAGAGGRRKNGTLFSGDQLRAAVTRRLLRRAVVAAKPKLPVQSQRRRSSPPVTNPRPRVGRPPSGSLPSEHIVSTDKDVSSDEIAAALASINKRK